MKKREPSNVTFWIVDGLLQRNATQKGMSGLNMV
jgi:hypothetical protein